MIDEVVEYFKKFTLIKLDNDETLFTDDFVDEYIEDLAFEEKDIESLAEYFQVMQCLSSIASRMRIATEEILALKIFDAEVERLEEE